MIQAGTYSFAEAQVIDKNITLRGLGSYEDTSLLVSSPGQVSTLRILAGRSGAVGFENVDISFNLGLLADVALVKVNSAYSVTFLSCRLNVTSPSAPNRYSVNSEYGSSAIIHVRNSVIIVR